VGNIEKNLHMLKIISIFAERYPNTIRGNRRKGKEGPNVFGTREERE
jgi:hypothetical protein